MKPSGFGDMNQSLVLTPMGGLVIPTGDFDDAADMGFTTGANLEYFVAPRVALSANFNWQSFGNPFPTGDGADFFFIGAGARGFMSDDAALNPFGRVAGGLYQGNSEANAGVNFGAGLWYRASENIGIFGEGSLNFVFGQSTGFTSSTATFFGLTGGVAITIPTGK
jgi:hypothetical protein